MLTLYPCFIMRSRRIMVDYSARAYLTQRYWEQRVVNVLFSATPHFPTVFQPVMWITQKMIFLVLPISWYNRAAIAACHRFLCWLCTWRASQGTSLDYAVEPATLRKRKDEGCIFSSILTSYILAVLQVQFYWFHSLFTEIVWDLHPAVLDEILKWLS